MIFVVDAGATANDEAVQSMEIDEETPVFTKERSESDIEIERQVHSLLDQIKGETSWQYHLTSPDIDEKPDPLVHEVQQNGHVNGHNDLEAEKNEFEVGNSLVLEVNGDVNANETDDVILNEEEAKTKTKGMVGFQKYLIFSVLLEFEVIIYQYFQMLRNIDTFPLTTLLFSASFSTGLISELPASVNGIEAN